jgi:hypothetical protein
MNVHESSIFNFMNFQSSTLGYNTTVVNSCMCDKNNKNKCNCNITQNQKMTSRYLYCSGDECKKNVTCDIKYIILNFEKNNEIYHVYQQNEREDQVEAVIDEQVELAVRITARSERPSRNKKA